MTSGLLAGSYSIPLVALSVAIAIAASYAALDMAARTAAARGQSRRLWLLGGAIAMGCGVWSMHYIGMLAFRLPVPVLYDIPLVALSLLAAILSSMAALFVVSRRTVTRTSLVVGGGVMGAGIAGMHYIGMAAMRMHAHVDWRFSLVALSIAIAIVVCLIALALATQLRTEARAFAPRKLGSAALMGFAIAGMHYSGMAAASFHDIPRIVRSATYAIDVSALGVAGITIVTFLVLALALLTSVMDRRYTERNLAFLATEERNRNLIERSLAGIYWSTTDGRILDCNEACARILGFASRDALLLASPLTLYADHQVRDRFRADLQQHGRLPDFESQLVREDGSLVWVIENAMMLTQPDGSHLIEGTLIDITARKRAEEELRTSEARLREEIVERQRMEVALHLHQRLESVGQLAAGIAHEINTPVQFVSDSVHFVREALNDCLTLLTSYQLVAEAMLAEAPPAQLAQRAIALQRELDLDYIREHAPEALDRAVEGLARIAAIVLSMKEFAHPDHQEMSRADLNKAVLTTLEVARSEYKYVADVITDLGDVPLVPCYAGEINQVVLNLVVNAAHAIGAVSGSPSRKGIIAIATRVEENSVVLEVRDTGCGMSEELLGRIFDPFFTTKEVGKGTGQGLAIARSIVVGKHRGQLTVESEVGVGSTFTMRLPRTTPAAVLAA